MNINSPSKYAKDAGLKNLTQVAELSEQSLQTLTNWYHNKHKLFELVVAGCVQYAKEESNNNG